MIIIKRTFALLLTVILLFCGCAEKAEETYKIDQSAYKFSNNILDVTAAINGKVIDFPIKYSEFSAFGFTLSKTDSAKNVGANQYGIFTVENKDSTAEVYIANLTGAELPANEGLVCGVYSSANTNAVIDLPQNIKINKSAYKDVTAAYGNSFTNKNTEDGNKTIVYGQDNNCAEFTFKDDILIECGVYNIIDPLKEGFSEQEPESIKEYKKPSELSSDLKDLTFYLYGYNYTMPLPVKELIKNGWINVGTYYDYVAPGQTAKEAIKLTYGNRTLLLDVKNTADYPTTVLNCYVASITSKYSVKLDLTLAGGCRVGSYASALESVYGKENFTSIKKEGEKIVYTYTCNNGTIKVSADTDGFIGKIQIIL